MKTEGITVIVPVYNTAPSLERCVESLLGQTVPVEIVLVDDGSTDGSGELCDWYAHRPNVTVLHRGNGGASAARNDSLKFCRLKTTTQGQPLAAQIFSG